MPVITTWDPLSQGLDAAAGFVQGGNDARDKALALARAREQTEYDRSEDQKRDKATADDFTERKSEFGQTQALNVQSTEANIAHTQHQDRISDAVEQTRKAMAPLLARSQALQNQYAAGEISTQQLQQKGAAIANDTATAQLAITKQFGPETAQLAIAQATANIGSTYAGTAATIASTNRTNALLPLETQQARANLTGTNLQNQGLFANLQSGANDPRAKAAEADYQHALTSYTSRMNTWSRLSSAGKLPIDPTTKKPQAMPAEPTAPQDFEADLQDTVDEVRTGAPTPDGSKATATAALARIDAYQKAGKYSPSQARQAKLILTRVLSPQLKAEAKIAAGGGFGDDFGTSTGGTGAGSGPFSAIIKNAAAQHPDIPGLATIARKVLGQESGGNVGAVSNVGATGLMQLMPDTARGLGVTNMRDPSQNIHGGVAYLAQMYREFKSWPLALAAYNAGPGNVAKYGMNALNLPNADPNYVRNVMGQA